MLDKKNIDSTGKAGGNTGGRVDTTAGTKPPAMKSPLDGFVRQEAPIGFKVSNPEIEKFKAMIAKNPGSRLFATLAELYRKEGMLDEAIRLCIDGLTFHPNYLSGRVALGRAYYEKVMFKEAKEELLKVIAITPDNIVANKVLGELFFVEGDGVEAKRYFERVLTQSPGDTVIEEKLKEIRRMKGAPSLQKKEEPLFDDTRKKETVETSVAGDAGKTGSINDIERGTFAELEGVIAEDNLGKGEKESRRAEEALNAGKPKATSILSGGETLESADVIEGLEPTEETAPGNSTPSDGEAEFISEDEEEEPEDDLFEEDDVSFEEEGTVFEEDTMGERGEGEIEDEMGIIDESLERDLRSLNEKEEEEREKRMERLIGGTSAGKKASPGSTEEFEWDDNEIETQEEREERESLDDRVEIEDQDQETINISTETIADIYVKQGHYEKALGIYQELFSSFPNREKLNNKIAYVKKLLTQKGHQDSEMIFEMAQPPNAESKIDSGLSKDGTNKTDIEHLRRWLVSIKKYKRI